MSSTTSARSGLDAAPHRATSARPSGWGLYAIGAAVAAWTIIAVANREPLYDPIAIALSSLMLGSSLAFLRWEPPVGREGFRLLGFFVAGQCFLATGLSVIQPVDRGGLIFAPTTEAFSFAVHASFLFSAVFLFSAWLTSPRAGENLAEPACSTSGPAPWVAIGLAIITALLSINFSLRGSSVGSVSRFGTLPIVLFNPGLIAPLLVASDLLRSRKHRTPIAIMIGAQLLITVLSSAIGAVGVLVRDIILAHICLRKRLPMKLLAIGLVFVAVFNPAKIVFRGLLAADGRGGQTAISVDQAVGFWGEALTTTWADDDRRQASSQRLKETGRRLDYNWAAAHVYTFVPDQIPHERGATYEDIPMVLVPRVFYPNKPLSALHTRSRWLVRLGIQSWEAASTTAVAIPAPAEAYWNFGWAGLMIIPLALGLVVGLMMRLTPKDPAARVAYTVLVATTLGQFMDMLVWLVPGFVLVGAAAVLTRIYCRIGRASSTAARQPEASRA